MGLPWALKPNWGDTRFLNPGGLRKPSSFLCEELVSKIGSGFFHNLGGVFGVQKLWKAEAFENQPILLGLPSFSFGEKSTQSQKICVPLLVESWLWTDFQSLKCTDSKQTSWKPTNSLGWCFFSGLFWCTQKSRLIASEGKAIKIRSSFSGLGSPKGTVRLLLAALTYRPEGLQVCSSLKTKISWMLTRLTKAMWGLSLNLILEKPLLGFPVRKKQTMLLVREYQHFQMFLFSGCVENLSLAGFPPQKKENLQLGRVLGFIPNKLPKPWKTLGRL